MEQERGRHQSIARVLRTVMQPFTTKGLIAITLVVVAVSFLMFVIFRDKPTADSPQPTTDTVVEQSLVVVGHSVEGRAIEMYSFGNGDTDLLFVGGIHGGYEWNSVLLAYQFIDLFTAQPQLVPANVTVSIIPSANPDGVFDVIAKEGRFTLADVPADEPAQGGSASGGGPLGNGRFNAHGVDLNRNFDCKWQPTSTWRSQTVSAGTAPFSEPEARAIRTAVSQLSPAAVVFWHSQSNAVYASECENGILPETRTLMNTYAGAAGYPAVDTFDAYSITGDAEGWLASIGIPAITVELSTHETLEWEKNLAGVQAVFNAYKQ